MNLKRHAYKKPFTMRRQSNRETDLERVVRNVIINMDNNISWECRVKEHLKQLYNRTAGMDRYTV